MEAAIRIHATIGQLPPPMAVQSSTPDARKRSPAVRKTRARDTRVWRPVSIRGILVRRVYRGAIARSGRREAAACCEPDTLQRRREIDREIHDAGDSEGIRDGAAGHDARG